MLAGLRALPTLKGMVNEVLANMLVVWTAVNVLVGGWLMAPTVKINQEDADSPLVSVAVTMTRQGVRSFHGAGKVQASTLNADMQLQRLLGHLPALVHKKPESVLVVACGAGITAGSFVLHSDVKRIVICDIEPLVPTIVAPMFGTENYHVVDGIARENPHMVDGKQVEVVYDDGRHFLRTTHEKFDIITSDPIDPWIKGCAALNTVEYYRMCRDHLNPGGSVSL